MDTEHFINNLSSQIEAIKPKCPIRASLKLTGATFLYIALLLAFFGLRPDIINKLHSTLFVAEVALLAVILFATCLAASLSAFPDIYGKSNWLFAPLIAFGLFAVILFWELLADNPPAPSPVHDYECLICITLFSLLPSLAMLFYINGLATTNRGLSGCLAVLTGFASGALALRLSEQTDAISHIIYWHYLPLFVFALIGYFLGDKFLNK